MLLLAAPLGDWAIGELAIALGNWANGRFVLGDSPSERLISAI
jgi:hypothetical protein